MPSQSDFNSDSPQTRVGWFKRSVAASVMLGITASSFAQVADHISPAHAALGCGVGMVKSGSGDGCVPAATGAVAGHMAADGIKVALSNAAQDPANANPIALMAAAVPGRTLDDGVFFFGGIVGGTAAALAGGGQNVQGDFALGQGTAENAIKNNYLKFDEAKRRAQLLEQCQSGQSCSPALIEELATLQALDKQRDQDLTAACGTASGGSRSSSACTVEYAKLEAARATFGPGLGMMDASDWLDTSSRDNIARTVQFLRWYEPSATDAANSVNRDRLTGVPLDEQGRYSARVMVGDAVFSPKYLPCATTECLRTGANLDMSDPGTQAYVRALDQQVFKDIGTGATVGSLVSRP